MMEPIKPNYITCSSEVKNDDDRTAHIESILNRRDESFYLERFLQNVEVLGHCCIENGQYMIDPTHIKRLQHEKYEIISQRNK
jgi:hypothetical protein